MKNFIVVLWVLIWLVGCRPAPPAKIMFGQVTPHEFHYDIYFESNTNLLSLYSDSYWQSPASTAFVCSLSEKPKFDVEHHAENPGRGDIEYVSGRSTGSQETYTFRSHVLFYRPVYDGGTRTEILSNHQVKALMNNHAKMGCKARIAVFIGPVYFSEIMFIDTAHIIAAAAAMPPR